MYCVCIDNTDYKAALELGKVYQLVPDENAAAHCYFRVIDESGEDYAYSVKRFFRIKLPASMEQALLATV